MAARRYCLRLIPPRQVARGRSPCNGSLFGRSAERIAIEYLSSSSVVLAAVSPMQVRAYTAAAGGRFGRINRKDASMLLPYAVHTARDGNYIGELRQLSDPCRRKTALAVSDAFACRSGGAHPSAAACGRVRWRRPARRLWQRRLETASRLPGGIAPCMRAALSRRAVASI